MKKIYLVLAFLLVTKVFCGGETLKVEGSVIAQEYNAAWKRWFPREILVYAEDDGAAYVTVEGARGYIPVKKIPRLVALLEKAQEWADKAKGEKIEVKKELGSVVQEGMTESRTTGVSFRFISTDGGENVQIVMNDFDWENQFIKNLVVFQSDQIPVFLDLVKRVPETLAKLKENKKKGELFK